MSQTVKIFKKTPDISFDEVLCLVETQNFERLINLHLDRCDSKETAAELAARFKSLAERFDRKAESL